MLLSNAKNCSLKGHKLISIFTRILLSPIPDNTVWCAYGIPARLNQCQRNHSRKASGKSKTLKNRKSIPACSILKGLLKMPWRSCACAHVCTDASVMKVFAHHPACMQTHTLSILYASPSHATDSSPSFETPSPGAQDLQLINLFFFYQPFYSLLLSLALFFCVMESLNINQ